MLMTKRTLTLLAAGAVVLAGCGSSKPTRAQYDAKANAICAQVAGQSASLVGQVATAAGSLSSGGQSAARELAGALQSLHTLTGSSLSKLRALQQPESGRATIAQFLSSYGDVGEAVGQAASAAAAGQPQQAIARLQQAQPAAQRMAAAAKDSGMTRCETLLPALGGASAQAIHATFLGENHHPIVEAPWRYTVTVTGAQGEKLSGRETTHYLYSGVVVGTEKPQNVPFTNGLYRDTVKFPAAATGHPLEVEAVIQTSQGSATPRWPIEVLK